MGIQYAFNIDILELLSGHLHTLTLVQAVCTNAHYTNIFTTPYYPIIIL